MLFVTVLAVGVLLTDHPLPVEFPGGAAQLAVATLDAAIGATVEPLDRATAASLGIPMASKGLVVTSLAGGGPAERAGIQVGDVIERINGKPIISMPQAAAAIENAPGTVVLTLNRHGHYAMVRLPVPALSDGRRLIEEGAVR